MRRGALRAFGVRGTPVYLHWTLPIGLAALGGLSAWGAVGVLILVLGHALGHALWARRFGLRVRGVLLHGAGGECPYAGTPTLGQQIAVATGGALGQLAVLLGALLYGALAGPPTGEAGATLRDTLVRWNAICLLINLLPVEPLDGARLWRLLPRYFGAEVSAPAPHPTPDDVARHHWRDGNPRGHPQAEARAIAEAALDEAMRRARDGRDGS